MEAREMAILVVIGIGTVTTWNRSEHDECESLTSHSAAGVGPFSPARASQGFLSGATQVHLPQPPVGRKKTIVDRPVLVAVVFTSSTQ